MDFIDADKSGAISKDEFIGFVLGVDAARNQRRAFILRRQFRRLTETNYAVDRVSKALEALGKEHLTIKELVMVFQRLGFLTARDREEMEELVLGLSTSLPPETPENGFGGGMPSAMPAAGFRSTATPTHHSSRGGSSRGRPGSRGGGGGRTPGGGERKTEEHRTCASAIFEGTAVFAHDRESEKHVRHISSQASYPSSPLPAGSCHVMSCLINLITWISNKKSNQIKSNQHLPAGGLPWL